MLFYKMNFSTFTMYIFMYQTSVTISHWLFHFMEIPPEGQFIFLDEQFVAGGIFAWMWAQVYDVPTDL